MTNEEAKKVLDNMYGDWRTDEEREALAVAISLIVEIEDIKAEIDEQYDIVKRDNIYRAEGLEMAAEIIDKHIGKEQK